MISTHFSDNRSGSNIKFSDSPGIIVLCNYYATTELSRGLLERPWNISVASPLKPRSQPSRSRRRSTTKGAASTKPHPRLTQSDFQHRLGRTLDQTSGNGSILLLIQTKHHLCNLLGQCWTMYGRRGRWSRHVDLPPNHDIDSFQISHVGHHQTTMKERRLLRCHVGLRPSSYLFQPLTHPILSFLEPWSCMLARFRRPGISYGR